MKSGPSFTALVVGLPAAGKTTFLAAFWYAITATDNRSSLKLSKLHPLRDYLNAISDAWLRCEAVPRTTLATEQIVSLDVHSEGALGIEASISFPDHAGEKFVEQWAHREWSVEYAELVALSDGVLLFINPSTHIAPPTISQAIRLAAGISENGSENEFGDTLPWDPRIAPADVQLVDLLQCILWYRHSAYTRVAVVISAWDLVRPLNLTPDEWLARKSPLLSQFLRATIGSGGYEVFGVSGQGGDLHLDGERLLDTSNPIDKVAVVGRTGESHDITEPVLWLLSARP